MQRIEVNVITGERKIIDLTPGEIDDALRRTAEEAAQPRPRDLIVELDDLKRRVANLEASRGP